MSESSLSQAQIRAFVGAAHGDLAAVKAQLTEEPALLNARFEEWDESALGAAAHTGQREIALYLLAQGAPLTICAAAMLGQADEVARMLDEEPARATANGAHGIPVLYHAALSGDTRIAELLVEHGGGQGAGHALIGACYRNHIEMARWLLAQGADPNQADFQGKRPLTLALERNFDELAALLRQHGGTEEK